MARKIRQAITNIYDWLEQNSSFRFISRASQYCSTDNYLNLRKELEILTKKARVSITELSEITESIDEVIGELNEEIYRRIAIQKVSPLHIKRLIGTPSVDKEIENLVIVAKRIRKIINMGEVKHSNTLITDADTLSNLILNHFDNDNYNYREYEVKLLGNVQKNLNN